MGGSAVGIDVSSVRVVMDGYHAAPQFLQAFHRCVEGSSLRTVYYDLQAGQIYIYGSHSMVNILFSGIGTVFDLTYAGTDRELDAGHIVPDQRFDLVFHSIRKLITVAVKELDPVELYRIVRGGDHNSRIYFVFLGQISHCRSRDHSHIYTVSAYGAGTGHQRIRKHIAGDSGIASYHDRRLVFIFLGENIRSRLPKLHCKQRGQFLIGNTAYAICSKHSSHCKNPLILSLFSISCLLNLRDYPLIRYYCPHFSVGYEYSHRYLP